MSRKSILSLVVASTSALVSSARASCEGKCGAVTEYCDAFVDECRQCSDICHKDGSFRECEEKCEGFLRTAVFREEKMGNELATLQIMLGVVTAVTSLTLLLVLALLASKVKRRKRGTRVETKDVVPLSEFRAPSAQSSVVHQQTPLGRGLSTTQSTVPSTVLSHGRSQHTVMTQLSEENSTGSNSNGVAGGIGSMRRTNTYNLSNGSSVGRLRTPPSAAFPARLPSEDCVPDPEPPGALNGSRGGGVFDNRGLDEDAEPTSLAISAVTGSTLPPIQNGRLSNIRNGGISNGRGGGPYTISHSQVV